MNVLNYARKTEQSGVRFYREMADHARNDGVRNIFSMLAHDEELLLEKLRRLQEKHPELERQTIRNLTANSIVFDKLRRNRDRLNIETDIAAYELARDAERQIIATYRRAADAAKETRLKKSLMLISSMERHELEEIQELLDFTNTPNQSLAWGEFSNIDEFHDFGRYGSN